MRNTHDGKWYDVGDRRAAEKASQALREKSQEEKKSKVVDDERSSGNHHIYPLVAPSYHPISGNHDLTFDSNLQDAGIPSFPETDSTFTLSGANLMAHNLSVYSISPFHANISAATPTVSLQVSNEITSPHIEQFFGHDEPLQEQQQQHLHFLGQVIGLTDQNGNIVVTDYDILCGRGGATNHHKVNI